MLESARPTWDPVTPTRNPPKGSETHVHVETGSQMATEASPPRAPNPRVGQQEAQNVVIQTVGPDLPRGGARIWDRPHGGRPQTQSAQQKQPDERRCSLTHFHRISRKGRSPDAEGDGRTHLSRVRGRAPSPSLGPLCAARSSRPARGRGQELGHRSRLALLVSRLWSTAVLASVGGGPLAGHTDLHRCPEVTSSQFCAGWGQ